MNEPYTNVDISTFTFLVTGGAGFIGSNLVDHLLRYRAKKVIVLDNLATGFKTNIEHYAQNPSFEFVRGDIRDFELVKALCNRVDFVSHQAALGSVPRSILDPITTNDVNVSGFLNVLEAVRSSSVKRMVYAASSSTYGDSEDLPKKEDRIGMPLSPYAVSKYANELFAHAFALNYGMSLVGLRYFNVFGPRQDPHGAYAAVIPLFIKAAIKQVAPTIHGDGKQSRDFTYVDNAVQANIKALFSPKVQAHEVINIACGEEIDLNELWSTIQDIAGIDLKPNYGKPRTGDVQRSLADLTKAKSIVNYQPRIRVREGLKKAFEYYDHLNL